MEYLFSNRLITFIIEQDHSKQEEVIVLRKSSLEDF